MQRSSFALVLLALVALGCSDTTHPEVVEKKVADTSAPLPTTEIRSDLDSIYRREQLTGSFVLYDPAKQKYIYCNKDRCAIRFTPASTFKIPNTLIALETGVLRDADDTIRWDGVKRSGRDVWNRDHNLRSAFRNSVVWYYQEIARRVGYERMQHFIDTLGYGNRDLSGGVDLFWLTGGLRISQVEQIDLLKRLYNEELPFSKRAMKIMKDIFVMEDTLGYKLSGKTGWGEQDGKQIGWLVGYVERDGNVYYYASNVERDGPFDNAFPEARVRATREILRRLGVL